MVAVEVEVVKRRDSLSDEKAAQKVAEAYGYDADTVRKYHDDLREQTCRYVDVFGVSLLDKPE